MKLLSMSSLGRLSRYLLILSSLFFADTATANEQKLIMPQWQLNKQDGSEIGSADFQNKPLIVHFWATWCPYCKKLQPGLQRLKDQYKSEGLEVIGVSFREDPGTQPQTVLQNRGLDLLTAVDGESLASMLSISGTPSTLFVYPSGEILGITRTSDPKDPSLDKAVKILLGAK